MQLLRDNLTLWTSDVEQDGDYYEYLVVLKEVYCISSKAIAFIARPT